MRRIILLFCTMPFLLPAQGYQFPLQSLNLTDMSAFRPAAKNWRIAGDVSADLNKEQHLVPTSGTGILVNLPDAKMKDNLITVMEHGDLDLETDIMMAAHSNSGIYLQGRYEIQLLDSWGKTHPYFGDMAGIYQRWDDSKPEGMQGYQGNAPRINVARAPGLWQHLRIEFQAPKFDLSGKKTANARIIKIQLNGVTVHENIELTGPTRGPLAQNEVAVGPILIQGDHGPVAFRNFKYRAYNGQSATLHHVKYQTYSWESEKLPTDLSQLKNGASGELTGLTWEAAKGNDDFVTLFSATLNIPKAGKYNITMLSNGISNLKIKGQAPTQDVWGYNYLSYDLPEGDIPIEIAYCKHATWMQPALGMFIEGPDFRMQPLHLSSSVIVTEPVTPIFLQPQGLKPELSRCFLDIASGTDGKQKRIVHPISVGYPDGPAYSYDLDCGNLIQAWRGGFLDATPNWNDRGDGHSDPLGSPVLFGILPQLAPAGTSSFADTLTPAANYHLGGYALDKMGNPTFEYTIYGAKVTDAIRPKNDGKILTRELTISGTNLSMRIAKGKDMVQTSTNTWAIDDKRYYIALPEGIKPEFRTLANGQKEMVLNSANGKIQYEVIF